ncbi:MAG: alpha/beta hydrolase, partial [Myxococcota bacterium]
AKIQDHLAQSAIESAHTLFDEYTRLVRERGYGTHYGSRSRFADLSPAAQQSRLQRLSNDAPSVTLPKRTDCVTFVIEVLQEGYTAMGLEQRLDEILATAMSSFSSTHTGTRDQATNISSPSSRFVPAGAAPVSSFSMGARGAASSKFGVQGIALNRARNVAYGVRSAMGGPSEIRGDLAVNAPALSSADTPNRTPAISAGTVSDGFTRGRPDSTLDARSALDGAFSEIGPTMPRTERWAGPTVDGTSLGEDAERAVLAANDNRATLAAYRDFDSRRPPVVLIHGSNGSPKTLRTIAERLRAGGEQVLVAFYDDRGTGVPESGAQVAAALQALREHYPTGSAPLRIVAHSMGGIVARAARN